MSRILNDIDKKISLLNNNEINTIFRLEKEIKTARGNKQRKLIYYF